MNVIEFGEASLDDSLGRDRPAYVHDPSHIALQEETVEEMGPSRSR
jgi:hypothetical protein